MTIKDKLKQELPYWKIHISGSFILMIGLIAFFWKLLAPIDDRDRLSVLQNECNNKGGYFIGVKDKYLCIHPAAIIPLEKD